MAVLARRDGSDLDRWHFLASLSEQRTDEESGVSHQVVASVRLYEMAETPLGFGGGVYTVGNSSTLPVMDNKEDGGSEIQEMRKLIALLTLAG